LSAITAAPAIYLVVVSLTPLDLTRADLTWTFATPWKNYQDLLGDARFRNSVWVQVRLSVITVTSQILIGLGLALLLNVRSRFLEAMRTVFLIPMVLPPIVVALIWKVLYVPDVSPVYRFLEWLEIYPVAIITHPVLALWAIALADTWEWFPFTMLILLAALQMIPDDPLEAARIDGAGAFQLFRFMVLPLVRPTIVVVALFRLIDSIKAFPLIYVITNGGPGIVTEVTNYYAFLEAFNFSYWGYASAIAVLMVISVFFLSWLINRLATAHPAFDA
jgi:multiple sugar transport system permease protein